MTIMTKIDLLLAQNRIPPVLHVQVFEHLQADPLFQAMTLVWHEEWDSQDRAFQEQCLFAAGIATGFAAGQLTR